MNRLFCTEHIADPTHNVMIVARNGQYDCYLMEHEDGHETPYFFMFGLPTNENTFDEAVSIALANVPDYYFLCEDEEK